MKELESKVAVVTGAASGIGRALAEVFAEAKMRVVLADIEAQALEEARSELAETGAEVIAFRTDVTDATSVAALAEECLASFGAVHVVCNNAGVAPIAPLLDTALEDWRWVIDVNLMGVVHGLSTFGPLLKAQGEGHIVNTASSGGLITVPNFGAYCATKHAVVGLSEALYQELAGSGVGVSVLCPGLVATRIFESERNRPSDGGPANYGETQLAAQGALQQIGVPPRAIAEAVLHAIQEERLHILPSPEVRPILEERFRCILEGENPARPPSLEDA